MSGSFQSLWDKIICEAVVEGRSLQVQLVGTPEQLSTLREAVQLARQVGAHLNEGRDAGLDSLMSRYRKVTGRWEGLTGLRWPLR